MDPPVSFVVSFYNRGRTPAEVISFEQNLECTQNTDDLPVPPQYLPEKQILLHTRIVGPGEEWRDRGESYFSLAQNFLADQWIDIKASKRRAMYWGRLRYRDLIEQPRTVHDVDGEVHGVHETCFCYFYSFPLREFLITGPRGYNKHT
jgi:hypothetical protein